LPKRETPHQAKITFNLDIRPLNTNGDLDTNSLSDKRLSKYHIGRKAEITISGVSEADCIKNVKRRLEKLNE